MSSLTLNDVLNRSLLDGEFRRAVQADPDTALAGLDLTDEERSAIRSRSLAALAPRAATPPLLLPPTTLTPLTRPTLVVDVTLVFTDRGDSTGMAGLLPEAPVAELTRRGEAIVRMAGDRVESLKEMLALMRVPMMSIQKGV